MSTNNSGDSKIFDAVVVGNGTLGLSLGLELARRGVQVAVLGKASRPFAASAVAGAMNGCFGEATPGLLQSEHGRTKLAMDVRATALWNDWEQSIIEASDERVIRSAEGTIIILNTIGVPEIDTAGYASIRAALDEYDEPYEDLDPDQIDWLAPEPTSRPMKAMFIPNEHAVDSAALLRGLATAFVRAGGTLIDEQAVEVLVDNGRATGVVLESTDVVSAPSVVLAAGVASGDLLGCLPPDVRARIPAIVSGYGVALLLETEDSTAPDHVIRTPNRAFACGLHVVPRGDGTIYLGATNNISTQPRTSARIDDLNLLLGSTRQMRSDLVEGAVHRIMVGNRPVPLDGFPLLGEVGIDGLWMMTGTYRDGLHQSPLIAKDFAARLLGEEHDTTLDVFTPVRKPIQALSRQDCLETAVRHTLALGYEQDWGIPVDWPPLIEEQLRGMFQRSLDELHPTFVPPAELLAFDDPEITAALSAYYRAHDEAS
ncbi:NAD(P)/FAD-dependent oxidoreductase [Actinoalloteichus hymeniacidonis]|uniref:Glycine/D-amino acid oxidase, deaminating n=2 Tax=Actinoalloteichus hymeniacidonis TaxID=340345 RepID=A0AAC9HP83_9PSEU|nr:FAD-dependent oxidoreductase [Actinoalloteichus hymeniacidonis]AOS62000.1 glycine/D-amino acid oxidase, deaminating [Actinoalloteichus hymeniacidonis]